MDNHTRIPLQYQQAVDFIAEMFSMPAETAHTCLRNANYDRERAIEKLINPQFVEINPYQHMGSYPAYGVSPDRPIDLAQDEDVEYISPMRPSRRTQFHQGGLRRNAFDQFKKTYIIKKKEKPKRPANLRRKPRGKATPDSAESKDKIVEQFVFQQELNKLLKSQCCISFKNDLSDVFNEMYQAKKLVAIHSLKFPQEKDKVPEELQALQEYVKNLYMMPEFVQSINKAFINYGLDSSKFDYEHYPFMNNFVKPLQDDFVIIILRHNQKLNIVEVFRKLRITEIFKLTEKERFKNIVNEIVITSNRVAHNHTVGTRPLTEHQKRKIEEDRIIRQQQQKEYHQNLKFQEQLMKQEQQQLKQQVQKKETIQEKKSKIKQNMIKYVPEEIVNPINFKIRLPSGSTISLVLPRQEKIQYIFNYVFCLDEQQAGFEDAKTMNFDILQPFEKLFLSSKKDEMIGNVFEGSDMETLIVKQN